jgi:quercetin dioxygenase-like cupin family protein
MRPSGNRPGRETGKEKPMNEEGVAASRTFGLGGGEGEARWWLGGLSTIKATGKQTGGQYTLVEIREPQGVEVPLHVHHSEDEAFYVLEGEMTFYVGDETYKAGPGSFVFGPRDIPHTYTIDSGPARFLMLLSPAGFEDFIEASSEPAEALTLPPRPEEPPDEAEMEQLATLAGRYGAEILGPPPGQ